jgi:hypothetical protein
LKTYKQLLEERTTLQAARQQIFSINPKADTSEIEEKINSLSEEVRSLEFNNIKHETICDDMQQSRVPEMMSFNEFKSKNEEFIIKNINETLNQIDTVPIGVYASLRGIVEKSKEYILRHNYNAYCAYMATKNEQ